MGRLTNDRRRYRFGRTHRHRIVWGALSSIAAHELGATVIRAALDRAAIDAADVSDVVLGHVLTAGQGQNTARQAAMRAGIPMEKAALTINQVCGSGLRAVALGYQAIKAGDATIVVAGGQENMSASAHCAHLRNGDENGRTGVHGYHDQGRPFGCLQRLPHGYDRGKRRRDFQISRADQDAFAVASQQKAASSPDHPVNSRTRSFRSPFTPGRATLSSTRTNIQRPRPRPTAWRNFAPPSAKPARSPRATHPVLTTVHR